MPHPAAKVNPIMKVAAALGLKVEGRKARCFNGTAHKSGTDEKPALVFQTEVNRFTCYACGVRGDAIDLVCAVRKLSFREAVQWLLELAGKHPSEVSAPSSSPSQSPRTPDKQAKEVYASLFKLSFELDSLSPGGKYLRSRGINYKLADENDVAELGDTSKVWTELTAKYGMERLRAAGLVSRSERFLFSRHRLLFFYFDDGWPQFVQARNMSGEASCKELSVAGLHSPVPFLGYLLKEPVARVLVCEGCIDTLSAVQLGYIAVGVPGVAGFREEWFSLFRAARRVTILFDNDTAGHRHSAELRARFRLHGIRADTQFPCVGKDLNDLLKALSKGEANEPK
jgi:DNA primase